MLYACEAYPTFRWEQPNVTAQVSASGQASTAKLIKSPMKLTGVLDKFESFDLTPTIGREFPTANLAKWFQASNADDLIRDLAVTGVYSFFNILIAHII